MSKKQRKSEYIAFKATPLQREKLERRAEELNLTLSEFIRLKINDVQLTKQQIAN